MKIHPKLLLLSLFITSLLSLCHSVTSAQLVPDFRVNDDLTTNYQLAPRVAADSSGNFVTVWRDNRFATSQVYNVTVFGQRYSANGVKIGENFRVRNELDTGQSPDIAVKPNGDFIVCWTDRSSSRLVVRLFRFDLTPLTDIILVSDSNYVNERPRIDNNDSGYFVIAWQSFLSPERVLFQRFDPFGNKIGNNVNVSDSGVSSRKRYADVTVRSDGSFIVCWEDNRLDPGLWDIYCQMYGSNGTKIGSNILVNNFTFESQMYPQLTSDSSGNFCVTWYEVLAASTYCQYFNNKGMKLGNSLYVGNAGGGGLHAKPNGEIIFGLADYLPVGQRMNSNRTFMGNSFYITAQFPGSYKILSDITVSRNKIISLWQDDRSGNFDIFCNIRSFMNPDSTVSIKQLSSEIPDVAELLQNYPNPFNPVTKIPFQVSRKEFVEITVYDILGRRVSRLVNTALSPGKYEVGFDGTNTAGGLLVCRMKTERFEIQRVMILLK
ncbi:MAG: hypothetical protein K1X85_00945 [Ignavibacteria bacterium]|nr:hypothetical protein [Ignavibacteria bacterium]